MAVVSFAIGTIFTIWATVEFCDRDYKQGFISAGIALINLGAAYVNLP